MTANRAMTTRALFEDLYCHMEWADATVWTAVLASEAACADARTAGTLHHLHLVQRAFLSLWRAEPVDRQAGENLPPRLLASWARTYYGLARQEIRTVSEERLAAPVAIPWTRSIAERLGFEPAPTSLAETMIQVCFHTAHHRGQLLARLRELGTTPPLIDFIAWVWQGRPSPPWP